MQNLNLGEMTVGMAAWPVVGCFVLWRILRWIQSSPIHPDPWDADAERAVQQADAFEVCHHCATPLPLGNWFCEHCGRSVGPYNNLMPYLNAFSEGEVFRSGVVDHVRRSPLLIVGYLLISLNYLILAPLYWILLIRNLSRQPSELGATPDQRSVG